MQTSRFSSSYQASPLRKKLTSKILLFFRNDALPILFIENKGACAVIVFTLTINPYFFPLKYQLIPFYGY